MPVVRLYWLNACLATVVLLKALDLMIEDKREEEKLILYSQYRKKGLLSDVTYYGASFLGQMIDPIALATGVLSCAK
jgi:hypothetical protein